MTPLPDDRDLRSMSFGELRRAIRRAIREATGVANEDREATE